MAKQRRILNLNVYDEGAVSVDVYWTNLKLFTNRLFTLFVKYIIGVNYLIQEVNK